MTEKQKSRFCDEFCKYREFYDKQLKDLGKEIDNTHNMNKMMQYIESVNEKHEALLEHCENCTLSEV